MNLWLLIYWFRIAELKNQQLTKGSSGSQGDVSLFPPRIARRTSAPQLHQIPNLARAGNKEPVSFKACDY